MTAVVVLGMHRSGTSCLAGMLAAGGVASAGRAVHNWDNARGHHEMLDAIRLDEAVLAHSGGHWLSPPRVVTWTAAHAATRDQLLRSTTDGVAPLLKDPRMLLALPFWRASAVPFHVVGIVRHPLAVARSLESWRELPLADGIALWSAHNRALLDDRARYDYAIVDFEQPKPDFVAAVALACAAFAESLDASALASAYEEQLVHHDMGDRPNVPGLADAIALYRQLGGPPPMTTRAAFPRAAMAAFARHLRERSIEAAVASGRDAIAELADASAVVIPVVTALVRHRAHAEAIALIAAHAARLDDGVADLLHGKVLLAMGDAAGAVPHLEAACAVGRPLYQARHLLPQALRGAGRRAEARTAMRRVVDDALYPHGPLATLAEWSWLDGDRDAAIAGMALAIATAPLHRRGRLRTRRAEWLLAEGDAVAARAELVRAIDEDPGYGRSREVLGTL